MEYMPIRSPATRGVPTNDDCHRSPAHFSILISSGHMLGMTKPYWQEECGRENQRGLNVDL